MTNLEQGSPDVLTVGETAGGVPLHTYHLSLGGREWVIRHTGLVLTYDEELHFLRHNRERMPYGVALWPASIALACQLADMGDALSGRSILELGAGTGLPGIVAASFGAGVVQTDRHELALSLCRRNCAANDAATIEHRLADWGVWKETERFDLIIGADILYTEALQPFLTDILATNLAAGGRVLVSDPLRAPSIRYLTALEQDGWIVEGTRWNLGDEEDPRPIGVFELCRE